MLELLSETSGNIVAIRATGVLTVLDEDGIAHRLADIFDSLPAKDRIRAFVDCEALQGFEPGAKTAGLAVELCHRALVERMAIVCGKELQDEVDRMADIFKAAEVRRFDPAGRVDAWTWLRSE